MRTKGIDNFLFGYVVAFLVGFCSLFYSVNVYANSTPTVTAYKTERGNYKNILLGVADDEDNLETVIDKYDCNKGVQLGILTTNTVVDGNKVQSLVEGNKEGLGLDFHGAFERVTNFDNTENYQWVLTDGDFIENLDDTKIIKNPTCVIVTLNEIILVSSDGDYTKTELLNVGKLIADEQHLNRGHEYLYMYVVEKAEQVETVMMIRE
jgi:hypothetical protein